jgi:DNA invertase Pin-like site-specific DNA recombinase
MIIAQQNNRIKEGHLNRKAIIYIRQSTDRQVQKNKESQRLQYALQDKAKQWGWNDIEIIDSDLGSSAAVGASERRGFERITSLVAVGEVGIIFSREASRLSRTDKDWCRLLEVCNVFDTLISDGDQVYDCNCMDDQLILGIKGTISSVELKVLQTRLIAGMEEKAKRGKFKRQVPPGYIWDASDNVVKDPNIRIRDTIELVFKKFREIQSIRQTYLWFQSEKIEVPVLKDIAGKKDIVWKLPEKSYLTEMLKNPFFAGVYVWGRETTKLEYRDGKVVKRKVRLSDVREAKVFIEDHHDGYIDLGTFDENQIIIKSNCLSQTQVDRRGAARNGQGLLSGILRCGRCGRKLYVVYYGKSGTAARYICKGDYESGGKYCLAFGGSTIDKKFTEELLKVLSSYGMKASIQAEKVLSSKDGDKVKAFEQQIKQLEYETSRAFEQYNEVDPHNRLVAAELERRWNEKLEELEDAKKYLKTIGNERHYFSDEEKEKILTFGERFSEAWVNKNCSNSLRKKIIRTIIEEVIVHFDEEGQRLNFVIHWKGGCHTEFEMPKPVSGVGRKTSLEDLEIIRGMAFRYGDDAIARVLNKLGRKSATGKRWNESRVRTIRGKYSIAGHIHTMKDPEILSLGQSAKYLDVSRTTIKRLAANGVLEKKQIVSWAPWEIKKSDLDSNHIRDIVNTLNKTGRLGVKGNGSERQMYLLCL